MVRSQGVQILRVNSVRYLFLRKKVNGPHRENNISSNMFAQRRIREANASIQSGQWLAIVCDRRSLNSQCTEVSLVGQRILRSLRVDASLLGAHVRMYSFSLFDSKSIFGTATCEYYCTFEHVRRTVWTANGRICVRQKDRLERARTIPVQSVVPHNPIRAFAVNQYSQ